MEVRESGMWGTKPAAGPHNTPKAHLKLLEGMGLNDVVINSNGCLMDGCLGAGLVIRMVRREEERGWAGDRECLPPATPRQPAHAADIP